MLIFEGAFRKASGSAGPAIPDRPSSEPLFRPRSLCASGGKVKLWRGPPENWIRRRCSHERDYIRCHERRCVASRSNRQDDWLTPRTASHPAIAPRAIASLVTVAAVRKDRIKWWVGWWIKTPKNKNHVVLQRCLADTPSARGQIVRPGDIGNKAYL